jgi:HEAT repeat protein
VRNVRVIRVLANAATGKTITTAGRHKEKRLTEMNQMQRLMLFGVLCGAFTVGCSKSEKETPKPDKQPKSPAVANGSDKKTPADQTPDVSARVEEIDVLSVSGQTDGTSVTTLVGFLDDESWLVRAHAARALGTIGAPAKTAAAELAALAEDSNELVRRQAITALVAIQPGAEVMGPLFAKLMNDSDPGVRMRVLNAAANAGTSAVPAMVEALKDEELAYWACLVIREIGPDAVDAVAALQETLEDERSHVQREAIQALAAIGKEAAPAVPEIAKLLDNKELQTAATFALGSIGSIPADAEATIKTHVESDDRLLATVSLWALARVHPEDKDLRREAATQLGARLKDEDAYVRAAASRALASLPPAPEITLAALEAGLAGADATTVKHALDALAMLGEPAVPRLIEALKHDVVRAQVAYILGQIGPAAAPATEELVKLIGDEDQEVGDEAVLALANIGPAAKAAVPRLVTELQKPDSPLHHAVVYALGKIGPAAASAAPALLTASKGSDASLSVLIAWAILQIRGGTAETAAIVLPALIAGLDAPLPKTRQMAAETLGGLGPLAADAVPRLKQAAADDTDKETSSAAADALRATMP